MYYWDEVLPEILGEALNVDHESFEWVDVEKALDDHVMHALEFQSYGHPSSSELAEERESKKIQTLKAEITRLERQLQIYEADVRRVHGGVYNYADVQLGRVQIRDR